MYMGNQWIHTLLNENGQESSFRWPMCLWLHSLFFKLTNDLLQLPLVLGKSCLQHDKNDAVQNPNSTSSPTPTEIVRNVYSGGPSD